MGIKTALPAAELGLYSLVLSGALAYSGRSLLEASQDGAHRKAFWESVRPGWEYIGRKMDVADFEWVMWFTSFRNVIIFALSGHVLFAKLCTMVAPELRSWMYAVYGALAVAGTMGPGYLLLLLSHCVSLYVASLLGQPWLCLGLGLVSLASFKFDPLISWQSGFVTGTFDLQEVLFHGGSGFTVLRCTSFALESCARPDRRYSLADLLKYNFYLPFFFFGPIMTFDRFHAQVSQLEPVRPKGELWCIQAQAGLSVVAIVAVDIFFHFFYILTIPSDLRFANRLPDSALAGLAYSNLVYDWVKSAVLFGVVNTVARLDHLDPPQRPKCITTLYVFAETHFDRGINDWLCKYVYDHIGGEHSAVIAELVATMATFAITTLWLGPCEIVYLWSFLNCFGLNFELWVQKMAEWGPLAHIEVSSDSLGLGWLSHWRGSTVALWSHPATFGLWSRTFTLLVVRAVAHPVGMWPSLPSACLLHLWATFQNKDNWGDLNKDNWGVWCTQAGCVGQVLLSRDLSFPIYNKEREPAWDSQSLRHIPGTRVAM
ncbi:protein-cysteine N-palmitoyltransferase HHAT-like protein isoform X1 [Choloepus didactylus]|uniref:protein-cysteine N-palmitoyltransferase HHAT-like protein isoform X1 n=1 Tax=Choloepus didactylus TaxID=27675 RepID=UPI00189D206D|nr:protein-cysteine N-palmitoyltransferase HHAT-like protein isoform X1 [Choloepus didactylus]XP_037704183.1 protein-cysteine N-palmitoyltransferase HHAT-like protein isoform X1 [Choloepus didactylus]XP_037704193.1 protein-cysteine N-palmitoyltransferase HHAT-like protein isoform X1 [Choloepus didactylus]